MSHKREKKKNPHFHCSGAHVQSLVRELRSHVPYCTDQKKKKNYHLKLTRYKQFPKSTSQVKIG